MLHYLLSLEGYTIFVLIDAVLVDDMTDKRYNLFRNIMMEVKRRFPVTYSRRNVVHSHVVGMIEGGESTLMSCCYCVQVRFVGFTCLRHRVLFKNITMEVK